jgi:hypothetical protein
MSGHAATALVLPSDRGQFRTLTICSPGEPIPTGQGESPFPLDFYLSWMSTKPLIGGLDAPVLDQMEDTAESSYRIVKDQLTLALRLHHRKAACEETASYASYAD